MYLSYLILNSISIRIFTFEYIIFIWFTCIVHAYIHSCSLYFLQYFSVTCACLFFFELLIYLYISCEPCVCSLQGLKIRYIPVYTLVAGWISLDLVDCSQSLIFLWDRWDIARLTVNDSILIFKCTEGAGVGDYSSRGRWARKIEGL